MSACGHTKLYSSDWRGAEEYPSCLLCQVESLERALKAAESRLDGSAKEIAALRSMEAEYGWRDRRTESDRADFATKLAADYKAERDEARSRLDKTRAAFRAADGGNDWCDASVVAHWMKSDKWLDLEEALFAGAVERQTTKCGQRIWATIGEFECEAELGHSGDHHDRESDFTWEQGSNRPVVKG